MAAGTLSLYSPALHSARLQLTAKEERTVKIHKTRGLISQSSEPPPPPLARPRCAPLSIQSIVIIDKIAGGRRTRGAGETTAVRSLCRSVRSNPAPVRFSIGGTLRKPRAAGLLVAAERASRQCGLVIADFLIVSVTARRSSARRDDG